MKAILVAVLAAALCGATLRAEDCNLKVVTDASPDFSDMPSLLHSVTSKWPTLKEKVWAMFYWVHLSRRQTTPMIVHGFECTDPIRQFNDYGFAMCSTVSGMNCALWGSMGMKVKFWDIANHTVAECNYDNGWHVYDSAFSAMYTLCDGKTIAAVMDVAQEGACAASNGLKEAGHIAKYHCLTCTSPNGFITGSDGARTLGSMHGAFVGHQYRYYWNNWDGGHHYRLNLREGETYTRTYHALGGDANFFIPNVGEHPEKPSFDPESPQKFGIRGNGVWTFKPLLNDQFQNFAHSTKNVVADAAGLHCQRAGEAGEIVYKITSANVTTSESLVLDYVRKTPADSLRVSVSTNNGISWKEVWAAADGSTPQATAQIAIGADVNGAYDILLKFELLGKAAAEDALLKSVEIKTITEINAKANPKLNIGKNTIYVGQGAQTNSIVLWPDNRPGKYKELLFEEKNIECGFDKEWNYYGWVHPADRKADAYVVYKLDTPRDMTRVTYGGRFSNRYEKNHIDMFHSLDDGKTWTPSYSLTTCEQPWDVLHQESIEIPAGHRSILFKYFMTAGSSIHNVHMEAEYKPVAAEFKPFSVTFTWNEVQADRKLVQRSHTQRIDAVPFTYTIDVGGADHPVMESLAVAMPLNAQEIKTGYSDGKDAGGEKYVHRWMTEGKNLAQGKPVTVSVDPKTKHPLGEKVLTDGVAGPPEAGGNAPTMGLQYDAGKTPEFTVDLGTAQKCGAFRIFITAGWPWSDAFRGEVQDKVEVLTSEDGKDFASRGFVNTNIYKKDVPINFMVQDNEKALGWNFELALPEAVQARYVKYKLTTARWLSVTELQVYDAITYAPFDIRLTLPDAK